MANTTKRLLGVQSVQVGAIESDGGMSQSLTSFGDTVRDSVVVASAAPTVTDFFIEETEDAVESVTTAKGATTIKWASTNTDPATLVKFFGGIAQPASTGIGVINAMGALTGGTGYVNGTYTDVPLTGGTGTGARATIVVAGGIVTSFTKTYGGSGYTASDALTTSNANLGGSGSGFSQVVSTVTTGTATGATWLAPSVAVALELSVQITDSRGNIVKATRVKFAPNLAFNFQRTKLGQIDISGTILQPTKAGEPSMQVIKAAA